MIPHANERVGEWRRTRERDGRLLVAIDFDGTLAPIVERPDDARLPEEARDALLNLAARGDTELAIISGRALDDLRPRVEVGGIYLAGNHGLEIEGPGVSERKEGAVDARPRLDACADEMRTRLADEDGIVVEDKGLTLTLHYRLSPDPGARDLVRRELDHCLEGVEGLRVTEGKKVFEVRPDIEWDKGRATDFLLDLLDAECGAPVYAIFIGDDTTDEDAFRALDRRGGGAGIIVSPEPPGGADTAATSYLRSPAEVVLLLEELG